MCIFLVCDQDKAQQRKQDLEDSLQAQQYFADANEAESWMKEKEPIAANTDYGKDEDSAEVSESVKSGNYSVIIVKCTYNLLLQKTVFDIFTAI